MTDIITDPQIELFDVLKAPHEILSSVAKPIEHVDDEIKHIFERMHKTMHDDGGIGLSANQVGLLIRILTVDLQEDGHVYSMANPEIIERSDNKITYKEGCLSFPTHYADVERFETIKVKYIDENNKPQELEASGLLSICIQHEIDHLDGILFVDHLSRLKRDMIMRKMKKMGGVKV